MMKRTQYKAFFIGVLVAVALPIFATSFPFFTPVTGVLKGNANSSVTTAAVSADIRALWSGTCDATTFLRGDGACAAGGGGGGGSVNSVALSMPTGFSVGGSPITTSGTLAVTTALNGVLHGNGSGFAASAVALGSEVSGTLPVANGGSGAATLTGVLRGNGTSAFSAATNANVISLWTGTCSASTFLRGDGACAAGASGVSSVGLTVPSGLTVTGSPVTTSGTLAITTALSGVMHVGAGAFTAGNVALGSEVLGVLPVANGGSGAVTVSGILHGNGTGAFTGAAVSLSSEVTGTLPVTSGGTGVTTLAGYVKGNSTAPFTASSTIPYADISGAPAAANPSAAIGLTAVNGSANAFMRSDGAPALSQSISPTWTGVHTFAAQTTMTTSGGVPLVLDSNSNATALAFNSSGVTYAYTGIVDLTGGLCNGAVLGDFCIRSVSGAVRVSLDNGVTSSPVCLQNGVNCPGSFSVKTAQANFTLGSPTCTINRNPGSNFSGCTYNTTGVGVLTFAPGFFSSPPVCTSSGEGGNAVMSYNSVSGGTVTVTFRNVVGTPFDGTGSVICAGT